MAAQNNLITDIPSVLAIECLRTWLTLKDVCLLDSANCCRKEREVLLALLRSPEFVVMQETFMNDDNLIKWLRTRSIRVRNITIQVARNGAEVSKYLSLFGIHVRRVHYETKYVEAPCTIIVNAITAFCHHLTAFTCLLDNDVRVRDLVENILFNNPDLELLELDGVNLDEKVLQGVYLPKLKQLQLTNSYVTKTLCEALSVSGAPQIERMDLSFTDLGRAVQETCWSSFRNVRALKLEYCQFMNDLQLQSIALNCPFLIHMCLYGCTSITDTGMRDIAMNLAQLRSLDIGGCDDLTDLSLQYLTQYRADGLETFYFDVEYFSSAVIADLFLHCHNLVEVEVSLDDQDWETIFAAGPTIQKWIFLISESIRTVPLRALAKHCQQLRELNIATVFGVINACYRREDLLFFLACCPQLRVLRLSSDLYDELVAVGIQNMYPHLQIVSDFDYPLLDALALPI